MREISYFGPIMAAIQQFFYSIQGMTLPKKVLLDRVEADYRKGRHLPMPNNATQPNVTTTLAFTSSMSCARTDRDLD
jgi:hypothetical protein